MLKHKKYVALTLLLFITFLSNGQEKFTLSGTISDIRNNETLYGVNFIITELKSGTTTNEYGFYSLSLPKGNYTIQVSYIGYETITETIVLDKNIRKNFSLKESSEQLDEVVLTDRVIKTEIKKPEMSVNKLSIQEIKQIN